MMTRPRIFAGVEGHDELPPLDDDRQANLEDRNLADRLDWVNRLGNFIADQFLFDFSEEKSGKAFKDELIEYFTMSFGSSLREKS